MATESPRRPRGRPPKADGPETAARLIEAATAVCAERGFDGTTLTAIAARAGVTPTAIYNHFESREALLYAAGVRGLARITALASGSSGGPRTMSAVASAYLRPEMRETRRLIAELHLASARDSRLAELLASWHRAWADTIVAGLPPADAEPRATVKALYLVLLGLCHFDDLASVRAPRAAVAERVESLVGQLFPDESSPP